MLWVSSLLPWWWIWSRCLNLEWYALFWTHTPQSMANFAFRSILWFFRYLCRLHKLLIRICSTPLSTLYCRRSHFQPGLWILLQLRQSFQRPKRSGIPSSISPDELSSLALPLLLLLELSAGFSYSRDSLPWPRFVSTYSWLTTQLAFIS